MKWIRPVNTREMFYHVAQQHQTLIVCYKLTLITQSEITQEVFKASLGILYKKVASFRLSIQREKESGLQWFVENENAEVDYKIITKGSEQETEMHRLAHTSYSASGLLWRSSLVHVSSEGRKEEVKETGHHYNVFFGFHHSISDGTANIKICNLFINILNDVMDGKQVDDIHQLGNFESRTESDEIFSECRRNLLLDPELEKKKEKMYHDFTHKKSLWTEAFPINTLAEAKTIHIERELDVNATNNLIKCFKAHGISVTTGFCSILNIIIADILGMNGVKREEYEIGTLLGVNLRQYWKTMKTFPLGYHVEFLRNYFETPHNAKEDFWAYASNIHDIVCSQVESKWCINTEILRTLLFLSFNEEQLSAFFKKEHSMIFYYSVSSLGNIDSAIEIFTGENVKWTGFSRTVSTHKLENALAVNFQTFRKKFQFSFEYVPKYVSEEVAECLADKLFDILKKISTEPPNEIF